MFSIRNNIFKNSILDKAILGILLVIILIPASPVSAQRQATPSATIAPCNNDNIPCPTDTPTPSPTPTNTPSNSGPTNTPTPGPVATSAPTATPKPTTKFVPPVFNNTVDPTLEPTKSPTPSPSPTPTPTPTPEDKLERSVFVKSISGPRDIPLNVDNLIMSAFLAGFLVLLIVFPAELFNSTVQGNYDEISKWSLIHRSQVIYKKLNKIPALILVGLFAVLGAIINSFLSPDIGFNEATYALVLGMLLALIVIVTVYDLTRIIYMKKRFGVKSKLRAHSIGLLTGTLVVLISRLSNFLPGYCYGIFTGLVYGRDVTSKEEGEGLAASAIMLLVVAIIGWFTWIPIKETAMSGEPNFWVLVVDAAFASLWVSTLTATIFGLAPMRYLYGEQVKKWNSKVWALIYFLGVFLFVYTLLNPAVGIYGKSDKVSWFAVLSLFFGFGLFSFLFWGYFRFRNFIRRS